MSKFSRFTSLCIIFFLITNHTAFGAGDVRCTDEDFPTYTLASQHQIVLGHRIPPIEGLSLSPYDNSVIIAYALAGWNASSLSFNQPEVLVKFLGNDMITFGFFKSANHWVRLKSDGKLTLVGQGSDRQSILLDSRGINFARFSSNGEKVVYTTPENPELINFVDLSRCETSDFSRCLDVLVRKSLNVNQLVPGTVGFSASGRLIEYRTYGSGGRPQGDSLNIVAANDLQTLLARAEINHFDRISSSVVSADDKLLAVADRILLPGGDREPRQVVNIYDIETGNRVQQAFVTADAVYDMAFHCTNNSILLHIEDYEYPGPGSELITFPLNGQQFPPTNVLGVIGRPSSRVLGIGVTSDSRGLFLTTEDGRTLFYQGAR